MKLLLAAVIAALLLAVLVFMAAWADHGDQADAYPEILPQ